MRGGLFFAIFFGMSRVALIFGLLILSACGPTGTGLDSIFYKDKDCGKELSVINKSSRTITLSGSVSEDTEAAGCETPQVNDKSTSIPAGSRGSIQTSLMCKQCWVNRKFEVSFEETATAKSKDLFQGDDGGRLVCDDQGCRGY